MRDERAFADRDSLRALLELDLLGVGDLVAGVDGVAVPRVLDEGVARDDVADAVARKPRMRGLSDSSHALDLSSWLLSVV